MKERVVIEMHKGMYVKYVAEPLMSKAQSTLAHSDFNTMKEREKHKIEMLDWFANSLDFNLIEQIRALMMKRIPVWK